MLEAAAENALECRVKWVELDLCRTIYTIQALDAERAVLPIGAAVSAAAHMTAVTHSGVTRLRPEGSTTQEAAREILSRD